MPAVADRVAQATQELQALHRAVATRLGHDLRQLSEAAAGADYTDVSTLRQLRDRCHRLAGTALTFGHEATGQQLQSIERHLDGCLERPDAPREGLAEAFARLPMVLAAGSTSLPAAAGASGPIRTRLYILEDDADSAELVRLSLTGLGYDVQIFDAGPRLVAAFDRARPDALLVGVRLVRTAGDGLDIAAALARRTGVPLMVMTRHTEFATRLRALRQGACACFAKPIDIDALRRQLDVVLRPAGQPPYRVLLIDDDADAVAHHAALLRAAGCETRELTDPAQTLEFIAQFRPELLVVDINMPDCSGAELAAVIRQDDDFAHLPIVFMSVEQSWARQRNALVSGGDGFLPKRLDAKDFVALLTSRLARAREVSQRVLRDSLTGLLQHGEIKERLTRELRLALRQGRGVAVAMVDIDHFKQVNDGYGHLVGDRVIQALAQSLEDGLRNSDLIGRYGGEEFLAILPDATLAGARERVDAIRRKFAAITHSGGDVRFKSTFSAGIALFGPEDDGDTLIARADEALYAAKRAGRDRVVVAAGGA